MMDPGVSPSRERSIADRAPSTRPAPVAFGPAGAELFGFHHAPAAEVARGSGVVLCNPLGFDAMCTHRTYRHLAERLAAAGFDVLRFDYHGTGDSSGHGDEPARLRAWLDGIGAAIEELRAVSGVRSVNLFGVRFGATLAALSAGERGDVRGLVLWGPCVSGRAFMRELRAFRMMKEEGAEGAPSEGAEEVAGYAYDKATVAEMSAIDLLKSPARLADRALILPRDELRGSEERFAAHLAQCGADASCRPGPGYALMMRDAQDTIVPTATLGAIIDWLLAAPAREGRDVATPPARPTTLAATSHASGGSVREESFHFGPEGRLFGILTEPAPGAPRRDRPAVLFLNVGANHRIGPNRMYVSMARDLAARGYLAFRVDLSGLGDSRAPEGAPENILYSKDSVEDVKAAMTLLGSLRGADRFVVAGICSGAYLSFHTAIADPRVTGQILINAQTLAFKEDHSVAVSTRKGYKSTRYYLGALLQRGVWAHALRGDLQVRSVLGVLADRVVARAKVELEEASARLHRRPKPSTDVERAFYALSDRRVDSLLVFSSNDGGLDMIEEHLGRDARKVRARKNIRLAIVEGADHTFTLGPSRGELFELITGFVEQMR